MIASWGANVLSTVNAGPTWDSRQIKQSRLARTRGQGTCMSFYAFLFSYGFFKENNIMVFTFQKINMAPSEAVGD